MRTILEISAFALLIPAVVALVGLSFPRFTNFIAYFGKVFFDEPNVVYLHAYVAVLPGLRAELSGVAPAARLFVLTLYGRGQRLLAELDNEALGTRPGERYRVIVGQASGPVEPGTAYLAAPPGVYLVLLRVYLPDQGREVPPPRARYFRQAA